MSAPGDRLTYANVAVTLGVVAALCGGAYAASALPRNSVRSSTIRKRAGQARGSRQPRCDRLEDPHPLADAQGRRPQDAAGRGTIPIVMNATNYCGGTWHIGAARLDLVHVN